jgi:N-acetylneuraminic acid mutarotase
MDRNRGVLAGIAVLGVAALIAFLLLSRGSGDARTGAPLPRVEATPGTWVKGVPMPLYRSEMGAALLDGKIYVIGGIAGPDETYSSITAQVDMYDVASRTWSTAPSLPDALHHIGVAALDGRVYVTGGYRTGEGASPEDFTSWVNTGATWVYTPGSDAWERKADLPSPRSAHSSVALGGRIYVIGGVGIDAKVPYAYDPATDTWDSTLPPMPTEREHLGAVALNGKIYAIGGRLISGMSLTNYATLESYDPMARRWTTHASMPTGRAGLTAAVVGGRIHVGGGEDLMNSSVFPQHEAYDPATDTWTSLPDLPTPRHGFVSLDIGGQWYVLGGGTRAGQQTYRTLSNVVEIFTP